MMNFTQNFKLTLRRMSRKWNIYAVASMIFLIPTILSTILSLVANSISLYKTSASSTSLMLIVMCYAMGLLSDDMIIENQIDINLMQRTMLQIMPYIIASAVVLLLAVFVALPGAYYFIRVARKENASIGQALKLWLKSVPVSCLTALLTFLWGLLFILPGIIKGIAYSQALNIKADNPEYSAMECVRRSNEMMNGRKGKYFLLFLIHSVLLVVIRYGLEYILSYLVVLIVARTIGGFYGRVCNVKDDILTIECGPDKVKLTISKGAVSTVDSADVENDKDVKLTPKDEAK